MSELATMSDGVTRMYSTDSNGESVVMYKMGGREYPMKTVRNCNTCTSKDYRIEIETAILTGSSFRSIVKDLPDDAGVSRKSIANHYNNGHMPLENTHQRIIIEERAREKGLDPEESEQLLADHYTLARLGVAKVFQKMARGELDPDIKDGIAFANFLDKVEERAGANTDAEALQEMIQVFFDAVMAEVGTDNVEAIARRAEGDPRMDAIRQKLLAANKARKS